ncbi:hypothetical protein QR680_013953 [Steinernema hermaphroditum]|uniref:Uncharacterized protein n=1 Tax=Steinernema hermaphroditum TaxID=289476 RepID=A0AA39M2E7_9BILA|nr:hypothetical protein QR680_013953 [Steinernema hermaphroditum]
MPLVQQISVLAHDAQFRCHIVSFLTGLFDIFLAYCVPSFVKRTVSFVPTVWAHPVFDPLKNCVENRIFPLVMLPLSAVAGLYFLLAPPYGCELIDPEVGEILSPQPREPSKCKEVELVHGDDLVEGVSHSATEDGEAKEEVGGVVELDTVEEHEERLGHVE